MSQSKPRTAEDAKRRPKGGDVLKKKKKTRIVQSTFSDLRGGSCVAYHPQGELFNVKVTLGSWMAWSRGAEVLYVAE